MRGLRAFGVAAGMAAAPAVVAAQSYTLEQVMSAPFPTALAVWEGGGKVAWVMNARGVRNLWVAEAPDYRGRPITDYAVDDGQELSDLRFTPDGAHVVYVRGGGPNRQGEIPNPTNAPEPAEQALWVVPAAGGAPRRLAEGTSPLVSPAGDRVVFLRGGQVWSVPLGSDTAGAARLFQVRGRAGSLAFSPDGGRLAFVSSRGDHAFIGVFDLTTRSLTYLDPSVDRDGSPVWAPDGTAIAFIRQPNERDPLPFIPRREGLPWSIRIVDVTTGAAREVWRASPGRGSVFRGVVAERQLFWGRANRIVFPWEGDGWLHLYAVPTGGGPAVRLTPGEFEVEHVTLNDAATHVVYSSNQGDIDRRHLWRVAVTGGPPEQLTRGQGIEWGPAVAGDGAIAFFASDARMPAHPEVLVSGARRPLARDALPREFPLDRLVVPQQVIFPASDGMLIHGQLFLPPDLRRGQRRPAVVFFHGGSRRQMVLGWHYLGYYHNAYALNQYLAAQGYIVLSVNYRSGTGYGLEFREAINYGANGASEYNDVEGAGLYLRSRDDVDPARIGLWGGSYGGYLTALGLARASDLFAAGVDVHGVHDWNVVINNFAPDYDPARREAVARRAYASSPMADVATWRSPVLVIHGDDDRNVPFSETVDLVEALRRRQVEVEQLIFPDEVHGFLLHESWLRAYRAAADFFDRRLKR